MLHILVFSLQTKLDVRRVPIMMNETFTTSHYITSDLTNSSNITLNTSKVGRCGESVHDKDYNKRIRIATLYITIIIGTIGGALVFAWMWNNRRLKSRVNSLSRVNSFILNLTVADLMVMLLAVLPQLIWEYQDNRVWLAGEFMCKFIKFLQSFSMMASTNMLVVIAIDRHQAITKPLKTPMAVMSLFSVYRKIMSHALFRLINRKLVLYFAR